MALRLMLSAFSMRLSPIASANGMSSRHSCSARSIWLGSDNTSVAFLRVHQIGLEICFLFSTAGLRELVV